MSNIASRIRRHLGDPESQHRKIALAFIWVSLFVFIGKLAGAAKEMALAWRYGVSETVDAYVFVFNLVSWPVSVWFSVLSLVLAPLVARLAHQNPSELPRFRGEVLGLTLMVGLTLGIVAWLVFPALLQERWLGLSDKALIEATRMAGGMALLVPVGFLISLFSVWMLACGLHRNTLLEAIPALSILTALLLPNGWVPDPLLWGTVAGFVMHMTALAMPLKKRTELQAPSFDFASPAWEGFGRSVGIMAVGQILMSFTSIIDQLFAARLGPGALSTLSYANRILALVLGIGAMAIGRATLQVFSEAYARCSADLRGLALHWASWMFIAGLGVAGIGWFTSHWVVMILFERGVFTSEDTQLVSMTFRYCLLQLPFYCSGLTLVSALAAQKRIGLIALNGAMNLVFKIIFTFILVDWFHLTGLVLSTLAMYVFSFTTLCVFFVKGAPQWAWIRGFSGFNR